MRWQRQGDALIGSIQLKDGRAARVVLVAERANPKGAVLVFAGDEQGRAVTSPLAMALPFLTPRQVVDILCGQERAFGTAGLMPPELV